MASFLKEKKLFLALVLSCIAGSIVVESKGSLQGDNIIFSPLPKGNNYTLTKSKSDWFLSSYDKIAEAVVLSLNYSPPYGKILVNVLCGTIETGNGYILHWPF